MRFRNFTPHAVVVRTVAGDIIFPSEGVARVAGSPGDLSSVSATGIPIYNADKLGEVEGLPVAETDTLIIVSAMVGAASTRADLLVPGTGPADGAIRENGQIVAVTRLKRPS